MAYKDYKNLLKNKRQFLNRDASMLGAISSGHDDHYTIDLYIGDCSDKICLMFDVFNERDYKSSMRKVKILREHVDRIEKALPEVYRQHKAIQAKEKAEKKAKKKKN